MSLRRARRCGEPFALGDRRELVPGQVAHLPLLLLRELVEAQDARVGLALARAGSTTCRWPSRRLSSLLPWSSAKWPRKNDPESIEARQEALDGRVDARGLRARPDAVGRSAQEALTGVVRDPDRGDRAAHDLARRVRARPSRTGELVERGRATRRGLRPARAHGGLAVGLALPRRAGGGRVRRVPDRGAARPDHARLRVRLRTRPRKRSRSGAGSRRELPKMRELARRARRASGSRGTRSCARSRRTSSGRSAT